MASCDAALLILVGALLVRAGASLRTDRAAGSGSVLGRLGRSGAMRCRLARPCQLFRAAAGGDAGSAAADAARTCAGPAPRSPRLGAWLYVDERPRGASCWCLDTALIDITILWTSLGAIAARVAGASYADVVADLPHDQAPGGAGELAGRRGSPLGSARARHGADPRAQPAAGFGTRGAASRPGRSPAWPIASPTSSSASAISPAMPATNCARRSP